MYFRTQSLHLGNFHSNQFPAISPLIFQGNIKGPSGPNKIHKNLVTRLHSSKDKSLVPACLTSENNKPICPLLTNDVILAAMNAKTDTLSEVATPAIPQEADDDLTIVSGTREKRRILEAYEKKMGQDILIQQ